MKSMNFSVKLMLKLNDLTITHTKAFGTFSLVALIALSACNGSSSNSGSPASDQPQPQPQTQTQQPPTATANEEGKSNSAPAVDTLSEQAIADGIDIKRMKISGHTFDVIDPNIRYTSDYRGTRLSPRPGSLILALCAPRFSDDNLAELVDNNYPIKLSSGSQALVHRDRSYQFGDGSDASSLPPYVLMTCDGDAGESQPSLSPSAGSDDVVVWHLSDGQFTWVRVPSPNDFFGDDDLFLAVKCGPRITDGNLEQFRNSPDPLILTKGSQVALRTAYFKLFDSSVHNLPSAVVISCE